MLGCYVCRFYPSGSSKLSEEHIFPRYLGGRRSAQILCDLHNNQAGHEIDVGFQKIFQPFRVFLGLSESTNGKPKVSESLEVILNDSNESYLMNSSGDVFLSKAKYEIDKSVLGKLTYDIKISTEDEAKVHVKQLKKVYPQIELSEIKFVKHNKDKDSHFTFSLDLTSELLKRSISKVVLNYAVLSGIEPGLLKNLVNYVYKNGRGVFVSHLADRFFKEPSFTFNHTVALNADPTTGLAVCLIEFFGCAPFLVLLSDNYTGTLVNNNLSFDPVSGIEVPCTSQVIMQKHHLKQLMIDDDLVPVGFMDEYKRGLHRAMIRHHFTKRVNDLLSTKLMLTQNDYQRCLLEVLNLFNSELYKGNFQN